jgi:hypothetical protein
MPSPARCTCLLALLLSASSACTENPTGRDDVGRDPDLRRDGPKKKLDLGKRDVKPLDPDLPPPAPKLDKGVPPPDLFAIDKTPSPCASGESFYGGRCYRVTGIKYISWQTGKTMCGAQTPPMQLAAITSAAENQFAYSILPALNQTAWIGLKRSGAGSSSFVWDSGEPLSYTNWAPGEPNNENGVEECVIMWGPNLSFANLKSKWNDMACEQSKVDAVVCERVP